MKPILMNTEMVKAILAGRKTVTRRLIKLQPPSDNAYLRYIKDGFARFGWEHSTALCDRKLLYQIGDVLYVRETWAPLYPDLYSNDVAGYIYKADTRSVEDYDKKFPNGKDYQWEGKWQPSIHMPKEAARIFLRVTDVRVERLRDITEEDLTTDFGLCTEAIQAVGRDYLAKAGWNSTIKKSDLDKYGWDANPWVWVIGFERISKEEALKNDK